MLFINSLQSHQCHTRKTTDLEKKAHPCHENIRCLEAKRENPSSTRVLAMRSNHFDVKELISRPINY